MKDKFVFNYKQLAARTDLEAEGTPKPGGLMKSRKQNYLHDHRSKDSFAEYRESLDE
jgi:hypothetical protein